MINPIGHGAPVLPAHNGSNPTTISRIKELTNRINPFYKKPEERCNLINHTITDDSIFFNDQIDEQHQQIIANEQARQEANRSWLDRIINAVSPYLLSQEPNDDEERVIEQNQPAHGRRRPSIVSGALGNNIGGLIAQGVNLAENIPEVIDRLSISALVGISLAGVIVGAIVGAIGVVPSIFITLGYLTLSIMYRAHPKCDYYLQMSGIGATAFVACVFSPLIFALLPVIVKVFFSQINPNH